MKELSLSKFSSARNENRRVEHQRFITAINPQVKIPNTTAWSMINNDKINFRNMRILVVDDDANSREMLSEVLGLYDADVKTADSVPIARTLYHTWKPTLLISDVGMPGEDGYDLIRGIRAFPQGKDIKAIAITGYARDIDRARALNAGYDLFLSKPVDLEQLINLIWDHRRN